MSYQSKVDNDDAISEVGGMFERAEQSGPAGAAVNVAGVASTGVTHKAATVGVAYGRGPIKPDPRKFKYDRTRGASMAPVSFGASKADRMDMDEAGELLDRIHAVLGIDKAPENVLLAFDKALFFEHTINGASLMQPGRGILRAGASSFEVSPIKAVLGVEQRRFFRAYADDVAAVNREVLDLLDPHEPETVERHGQLVQVAVERGLQKYPYLAHDSSDAGLVLSVEERVAIMGSKRLVLEATVNNVDKMPPRMGKTAGEKP